jgi:hypothetical protein
MEFEIKIQHLGQTGTDSVDIDGDLDAVKTYLKLVVSDNFNWGAVERKDELQAGDVNRWLIRKDRGTDELTMTVFSFFGVDPEINVNALLAAGDPERINTDTLSQYLGGGKF